MITNSRYCTKRRRRLYWFIEDQPFTILGEKYVVPAYYEWDGLSIPLPFQWLFPRNGRGKHAAALHDFLYDTKGKGLNGEYKVGRIKADIIFFFHLVEDGVNEIQSALFTSMVLLFAWFKWNKNTFPEYLRK
jgi:hypothetical protein